MSWHRTDDTASLNPKLGQLTDSEHRALDAGLWLYCARRRNGGLFDAGELPAMVYVTPRGPRSVTRAHLARFEALGLVDRVSNASRPRLDCFMVHDWLLYNGETIAEKVGAWLTKFPDSSANETYKALGGKRETVLAEHARHLAERVPERFPGTTEEPPLAGTPTVPLTRVSDPVPSPIDQEPVPVPTPREDPHAHSEPDEGTGTGSELLTLDEHLDRERANGRPEAELQQLGTILASAFAVDDPEEPA